MSKHTQDEASKADFRELLLDHEDKWVVLSYDEKSVLASSKKLEDLSKHLDRGRLMKVPRFDALYTPHATA